MSMVALLEVIWVIWQAVSAKNWILVGKVTRVTMAKYTSNEGSLEHVRYILLMTEPDEKVMKDALTIVRNERHSEKGG